MKSVAQIAARLQHFGAKTVIRYQIVTAAGSNGPKMEKPAQETAAAALDTLKGVDGNVPVAHFTAAVVKGGKADDDDKE